jgi:hypothetical protein
MLSPPSGRLDMDNGGVELCRDCYRARSTWKCLDCRTTHCDVCVRLNPKHGAHRSQVVPLTPLNVWGARPQSFCNGCGASPLPLPFFHCMTCADYDLCAGCEEINSGLIASKAPREKLHDATHPMIKHRVAPLL